MLLDKSLLLSNAQFMSATTVSANTVDLLAANTTIGDGSEMGIALEVRVDAAPTGTYVFEVVSDDLNTLASPTVIASRTIPAADLTAGSQHFIGFPPGTPRERYIGLKFTLGGTSPDLTVTAWVAPQDAFARTWRSYPRGYVA